MRYPSIFVRNLWISVSQFYLNIKNTYGNPLLFPSRTSSTCLVSFPCLLFIYILHDSLRLTVSTFEGLMVLIFSVIPKTPQFQSYGSRQCGYGIMHQHTNGNVYVICIMFIQCLYLTNSHVNAMYPLVNIQKTMDKHHFQWVNPLSIIHFPQLCQSLPEDNYHQPILTNINQY